MGRREQENARAKLRQTHFWKEELRGLPAKMYFKVDLDRLAATLLGEPCQTSMADSAILDRRNAPYKKGGKRQAGMAESAKHTISETTPEITPENTHTRPRVCDGPPNLGPESETTPTSETGAILTKNQAGQGEQDALVETVFQNAIQAGQEIRNPAAYKAALARAAARGELVAPLRGEVAPAADLFERNRRAGATWAARMKTWDAYSSTYQQRYGVAPVQNVHTAQHMSQLVIRLGAEAGTVAAWYVGHNGALYVRAKHPTDLLLRDCEGLRTEWARGCQVTDQDARHVDRRQATANAFAPLLEEAEREAKERG